MTLAAPRQSDSEMPRTPDRQHTGLPVTSRTPRVRDSAQAVFEIDDYERFVGVQAETAIRHLASAYAPEIAQVMLRRQQAEAIVSARHKIVAGAVGMVEAALKGLSERGIVELDDERKAAMVSNLLVVLCSDREVTPVVNTGTLYT